LERDPLEERERFENEKVYRKEGSVEKETDALTAYSGIV
jgi:hypothetical protein